MLGITIADSRFEFGRKIGSGSFGSVYYGYDAQNQESVAIKIEQSSCQSPQLEFEARLYKSLGSYRGLPMMRWFGQEAGCNVMVLTLLGPSLADLMHFCGPQLSLKTVLQIGQQVIDILEYLHSCNFLHRDIKPANFLVGRSDDIAVVHLIDFGLAKRYLSSKTGTHIPYRIRTNRGIIGSARYASVNAHKGAELSRRDDIESFIYTLLHMIRGNLPWQRLTPAPENKEERNARIAILKVTMKGEEICQGVATVFASLLLMARALEFEEKPNYEMMRRWIKLTASREGIVFDQQFDWTIQREEGELVTHVDDDERQSCSMSQGSLHSSRESRTSSTASATACATTSTDPAQGPLARLARKSNTGNDKFDATVLAKAMQKAGATVGPLWEKVKEMGVKKEPGPSGGAEGDPTGEGEGGGTGTP